MFYERLSIKVLCRTENAYPDRSDFVFLEVDPTTMIADMRNPTFASHQDILRRCEFVIIPELSCPITAMYSIDDQCRIELIGQRGYDDNGQAQWEYAVRMPVMCLTEHRTARMEVHFSALLSAPLNEEKMRYGCQLQVDCSVYPLSASPVGDGMYRVVYDAHISLYASCHNFCPVHTAC